MVDFTKGAKEIAIDLINESNGTAYTAATVTLGAPVDNNVVANGLNTRVLLTLADTTKRDLGSYLYYDRINIDKLLSRPYCQLDDKNPSRLNDLLTLINAKYNIALAAGDIVDGPYRPADVATGIKSVTLTVTSTNLAYKGSVVVYVGDGDLIWEYFNSTQYQFANDLVNIAFSGGSFEFPDKTILGPTKTVSGGNGNVALYITRGGELQLANSYPTATNNILVARFKGNSLCEVLGPKGETSYTNTGDLYPAIPSVPEKIAAIPEPITIAGNAPAGSLVYSTTYNVGSKKATSGTAYYVDAANGSDNNDGTSEATAFATFGKALSKTPVARIIFVKGYEDKVYDTKSGWFTTVRNRKLDVIGIGTVAPIFTSTVDVPVANWVNQSGNCWYAPATNVAGIVDTSANAEATGYSRYQAAASLAACVATSMSYYFDEVNGRIYVHAFDNRKPDAAISLVLKVLSGSVADGSEIYLENLRFDRTYSGFLADMTVERTYGYLYLNNVKFGWTFSGANLTTYGFNVVNQGCTARYGKAGGFVYKSDRIVPNVGTAYWVIEINADVKYIGAGATHTSPGSYLGENGTAIRLNGKYDYIDGNHVFDDGDNTNSLNIALNSTNNTAGITGLSHYLAGLNSTQAVKAEYWSCRFDSTATSYNAKNASEFSLFDTTVGLKPMTLRLTPYKFIYTQGGQ